MRQRLKLLLLVTVAGVVIGVAGEVWSPAPFSLGTLFAAVLMSPLTVTFGGGHVTIEEARHLFLLGGLLFWPVYAVLAAWWLRLESIPALFLLLPWTAQGFFQVCFRLEVMSGV